VGRDTNLWLGKPRESRPAMQICSLCPVRAECLYDALRLEQTTRGVPLYGIRGGLTGPERRRIADLPRSTSDAIAALREHLAAQNNEPPAERNVPPMTTTDTPTTDPELVTISTLLRWAEEHPDQAIREQGARAEATLTDLRKRYAADQELTAITTEAEQLEKRLAELRTRQQELAPPKTKGRRTSPSYDAASVRAWARENNVECPERGRVPKAVLDAWKAATVTAGDGSS
jgi:hypothetical protein